MKLQILITHYKEPEEVIKPLLDSIRDQKDVPFKEIGVIIVNDGDEGLLSDKFLSQYEFKINYLIMPKGNVSKARNYALDHATAKYVMFCDCDDMFFIDEALWVIFREMKKPFQVLNAAFYEERDGKGIPHEHDNTFIHGKVWNRQYLIDNDLRFDEELSVHEDGYFVTLAQSCADTIRYYDLGIYLWCEGNTVSRQVGYLQRTWGEYCKAKDKCIAELLKRGLVLSAKIVLGCFIIETKERNLNSSNLYLTALLYDKYRDLFNSINKQEEEAIIQGTSRTYYHKTNLNTVRFDMLLRGNPLCERTQ